MGSAEIGRQSVGKGPGDDQLRLLLHPLYHKIEGKLSMLLWISRFPILKKHGKFIFWLQKKVAPKISYGEDKISQLKNSLKTERDPKTIGFLIFQINIYENTNRILRTIVDGIVWRNLGFNRPLIRTLSDNKAAGPIKKELEMILRTVPPRGGCTIVNDLSRYCRIGDFTHITKTGIFIVEAKTKHNKDGSVAKVKYFSAWDTVRKIKRTAREKNITSQEMRQLQTQHIVNNKMVTEVRSGGVRTWSVPVVDSPIKIVHFFKTLKKLSKISKKFFYASQIIEEGIFVEVLSWDALRSSDSAVVEKLRDKSQPFWVKDRSSFTLALNSSSFVFGGAEYVPRNTIPPANFPLSATDCVRIMMGITEITIFLHLPYLKKRFEERGWVPVEDDWKRVFGEGGKYTPPPAHESHKGINFPHDPKDVIRLRKQKGQLTIQITFSRQELLVFLTSYYHTDFLLDSLDFTSAKGTHGTRAYNFLKERDVLL